MKRQFENVDRAAGAIAHAGAAANNESVELSAAAKSAAASPDTALTSDIETPMVDLRVSKYLAIANMKVIETGDEVSKELERLGGR